MTEKQEKSIEEYENNRNKLEITINQLKNENNRYKEVLSVFFVNFYANLR